MRTMLGFRSAANKVGAISSHIKKVINHGLLRFIEGLLKLSLKLSEYWLRILVRDEVLHFVGISPQIIQLIGVFHTEVVDVLPLRGADCLPAWEERIARFVKVLEERRAAPVAELVLEHADQ